MDLKDVRAVITGGASGLGFATDSDSYDEDGIEHIEMLRPAAAITKTQ